MSITFTVVMLRADRCASNRWQVSTGGSPLTLLAPHHRSEFLGLPGPPLRRWVEGVFSPVDVLGDAAGHGLARTDTRGRWRQSFWADGRRHEISRDGGDDRRWVLHENAWVYGTAELLPARTTWRRLAGGTDAVRVDMPPLSFVAQLFVLIVLVRGVAHDERAHSP